MRNSLAVALSLVAAFAMAATPETAYYRVELSPSGGYVAVGAPVFKGTMVLFHLYPDGKLMSLRKSDVKKVSQITAQEAAAPAKKDLVSIGNLAMQGGAAPAAGSSGARASNSTARTASSSQAPAVFATRDGLAVTTAAPPPK